MLLLGEKKYEELTQTFTEQLKDFWAKSPISNDIIDMREKLNDTWNPEETSFMNWKTTQGPVVEKTFRLQNNYNSKYTLSFITKVVNKKQKIANLKSTIPYEQEPPKDALATANQFVSHIQDENYSKASKMVLPPSQQQMTDEIYQHVRGLLVTQTGEKTKLSTTGHKTFINGVWYETIVLAPKNGFMQHLTLYLALVNENYSIATFEFKNPQKIN